MDLKDNEKELQRNLDLEFRRILRIIKPYIPCVMNNDYLTFYRLWLEKLSETDSSEKQERNNYLIELCYQIQDGILEYPFSVLPRSGILEPLRNTRQSGKDQTAEHFLISDLALPDRSPEANTIEQRVINFISSPPITKDTQNEIDNANYGVEQQGLHNSDSVKVILKGPTVSQTERKSHKKRNQYTLSKELQRQKTETTADKKNTLGDFLEAAQLQSVSTKDVESPLTKPYPSDQCSFATSPQVTHMKYPAPSSNRDQYQQQNLLNMGVRISNVEDDESSWCDLTDFSTTTAGTKFGSGDSDRTYTPKPKNSILDKTYEVYENKILQLMNTINDLQRQNVTLNEDVAKYERDLTLRNTKAETSLHTLAFEVNSLKTRLQELTEIKAALKNSHLIVATQWETTVNALNKELQMTQNNNESLKVEVADLQKKLEDITSQRQKDNALLRLKLSEMHSKEIEMLKQNHARQVTEIESKYSHKTVELQQQYEAKISELTGEYKRSMKCKDMEIQRLELMINTQCKKMHEEVSKIRNQVDGQPTANTEESIEKVTFLQKCVTKMDKLFKKSEKHFKKQILKLKREIELRDKIIQIQLSTQRAELISNTNTDRQIEVDATVVQLEERYRKLLETQQAHFLSEKKHDSKLISDLRSVIAKNNVENE